MHPSVRTILLTTAVALLGATGPASAAETAGAPVRAAHAVTRAELLAAAIPPGFGRPTVRASRRGLTVVVRNTGVANLNVRITASEVAGGGSFGYRPVFQRLAPGATASVRLAAPPRLARLIVRRRTVRRRAVVTVVNAESNAERTVARRLR